ncbi:hypothetical protein EVAR_16295_1 [Eumeta japonica]|uniref:Uncharacterized protein n=1 Tax=Eumeta variegata TaxID=151549 RepID=A0A4C1ZZ92_EUMVA|nr:hypothetical protein EVAR_16295_1 [Eumeta japonica]
MHVVFVLHAEDQGKNGCTFPCPRWWQRCLRKSWTTRTRARVRAVLQRRGRQRRRGAVRALHAALTAVRCCCPRGALHHRAYCTGGRGAVRRRSTAPQ